MLLTESKGLFTQNPSLLIGVKIKISYKYLQLHHATCGSCSSN